MRFCVAGGLNLDVIGTADKALMGDSNVGSVHFSPGGVGYNIACALRRLGHEAALITVLNSDLFGAYLKNECALAGIDVSQSVFTEIPSSAYVAVHSREGDLICAVNDMPALRQLNRKELAARADYINSFDALVTEANLEEDALKTLSETAHIPIIADGVSANKCKRLNAIIPYLSALKLNLLEAQTLSGETAPRAAGQALLRRGAGCVLVSLGSEGVYACDEYEDAFLKPEMRFTCQTNGAGDAMCAGLAEGCALGLGAVKCAGRGMACAAELLSSRQQSGGQSF